MYINKIWKNKNWTYIYKQDKIHLIVLNFQKFLALHETQYIKSIFIYFTAKLKYYFKSIKRHILRALKKVKMHTI